MTISRSTPIHGTGHTVGEVIDETVRCLPVATASVLGGVKIGGGVDVTGDGTISVAGGGGGGGGGGSPQPGQPTRFLTLTYTHPGNEDGSSASATVGIAIPDSAIAEGTAWILTVQLACVIDSSTRLWFMSYDQTAFVFRLPGQNVNGTTGPSSDVINVDYSDFGTTSTFTGDPQWDFPSFIVQSGTQALAVKIKGMSTDTPTDWTINVQLTPIAP